MLDERYRDTLLGELAELVRIPSRSFPEGGEEGRMQQLVAERMREIGARVRAFEVDEVPGARSHPLFCGPERQYEGRPTVIGEIGPRQGPALLVMAHSDTVPLPEPEKWTCDPFGAEIRGGSLYGLGSADDGWGVACLLSLMRAALGATGPVRKRIVFASTIDEENGVGNGLLLLMLAGVKADAALYLDGRAMRPCIGNCGGSNLYLRPNAPMPEETFQRHASALRAAARELSRRRERLFERPFFRDNSQRAASVLHAVRTDAQGPYHLLPFYTLPGEDRDAVCALLGQAVADALGDALSAYALCYREPWFEPALGDPRMPLLRHMTAAYEEVMGEPARISTVSKQDAFVFQNHAGIPTVSFGVSRIEGRGAPHQPDECVVIEDAWRGLCIAHGTVQRWLEEGTR